jgi:endonuclease/exonuclease/phosphatase family metal-dependent hydrolase
MTHRIIARHMNQKPRFTSLIALGATLALVGSQKLLRDRQPASDSRNESNALLQASRQAGFEVTSAPAPLSYAELGSLLNGQKPVASIDQKVNALLQTPFIYKNTQASAPAPLDVERSGPGLRVAAWNIERGFELKNITSALTPGATGAFTKNPKANDKEYARGVEEAAWLAQSQVLMLSEADFGMNRTNYQNTVLELAKSLGMHAAYGVEFIELSPLNITPELVRMARKEEDSELTRSLSVPDPERYLGLHGSAILSKYPIHDVKIVRLPQCYDWFESEIQKKTVLEKAKRVAADKLFLETVLNETRRGGRMALIADLDVPGVPGGKLTVVQAHLENRTPPKCRNQQLEFVLANIRDRKNPVVFGGDWNSTEADASPTSVMKEIRVRLTDPAFLAQTAVSVFVPFGGVARLGLTAGRYAKNWHDPTAVSIPLASTNNERPFFQNIRNFEFEDGYVFDLRGEQDYSYGRHDGYMSNSNQRDLKGFTPSFSFERPLLDGVIGTFKIDWIVVKSYLDQQRDKGGSRKMAPRFGRTLKNLNAAFPQDLSDHAPVTVDIPFGE